MTSVRLRLYVAGRTTRAETAIDNLRRLCEERLGADAYELDIVDVLEHPGSAEQDRILMTPTLVKQTPLPVRRIVGDMSDLDGVSRALGLPDVGAGEGS